MNNIKKELLYGFLIVVPFASIVWLLDVSVRVLTGPLSKLIGFQLNNINGVIISLLILWGIGFGARKIVSRSLFPNIEAFLLKIPIIGMLYRALRQIAEIVLKRPPRFLATVFIEYPSKGIWSLGFITNNDVHCLTDDSTQPVFEKTVSVFIPSTPNPMNGIFVFVDASQVQYSSMSVEEGVKCLMSAGMIVPEGGMGL